MRVKTILIFALSAILSLSAIAQEKQTFTVRGVSFDMIKVEGGTFEMGSLDFTYDATHSVTLSDYYIGETEVTQELWKAVTGRTVVNMQHSSGVATGVAGVGLKYPIYYVTWSDCQMFIERLNELTGKRFRLPTEAEWEYAARGGKYSCGYKYAGSNNLADVGWYGGNSNGTTHPVGTKTPNELGLYDMSGNVMEWCNDRYASYSLEPSINPTGALSGKARVLRGGSWNNYNCRVDSRANDYPGYCYNYYGFRLVLCP